MKYEFSFFSFSFLYIYIYIYIYVILFNQGDIKGIRLFELAMINKVKFLHPIINHLYIFVINAHCDTLRKEYTLGVRGRRPDSEEYRSPIDGLRSLRPYYGVGLLFFQRTDTCSTGRRCLGNPFAQSHLKRFISCKHSFAQ